MTPTNRTAPRHASQGQSLNTDNGSAVSGPEDSTEATGMGVGMTFPQPRSSMVGTDTPKSPEVILTALLNLVWKDVTERLDRIEERQARQEATLKIVRINTNPKQGETHAPVLTSSKFKGEGPSPSDPAREFDASSHVPAGAPRLVENSLQFHVLCPVCGGEIFKGEHCYMSRNVLTGKAVSFHCSCFKKHYPNVGAA